MPKFLEQKLEKEAAKKGKTGRAKNRYVYGAMNRMGAMRGNRETAKGAAMQAKHERKVKSQKPRRKRSTYRTRMDKADL